MDKIGIGFIGAGFAADLHAHALAPLRGVKCELIAVCSRTRERAEAFARTFGVPHVYTDHRALLARQDIHLVTLPVVTSLHHVFAIDAARAGKHLIVEKPLTGCFVEGSTPRPAMLTQAMANADAVLEACRQSGVTLCYAEDFVYAPPVAKLRRLLDAGGGAILELRAEESHSGSHAAYARRWKSAGGGALLRMGSHPVGAVLHLKHWEGLRRRGRPVRVRAVCAEVASLTRLPAVSGIRRHMSTLAEDVEDWSVAVLTFEDGTMATIHSNDITLGGVRNVVTAYLTNAVIQANINPNTAVTAYAPDAFIWNDTATTEKVETKAG